MEDSHEVTHLHLGDDEPREPRETGDQWLRRYLFGAMAAGVVVLGGWWINAVDSKTSANDARLNTALERLAALEANVAATQREVFAVAGGLKEARAEFSGKLDRMDGKLDGLNALLSGRQTPTGSFSSRRFDK